MTPHFKYILSWALLTVCALFNVLGSIASKAWQHDRSTYLLALCLSSFLIDLIAWIGALYFELDVGLGSILFVGITTFMTIISGFYFSHEPITARLIIGGILVLLGSIVALT